MEDPFAALADPTRRRILELLRERERSVGELVERFTLSQPAISGHLRVLRDAELVSTRREAQRRLYAIDRERLHATARWLLEL